MKRLLRGAALAVLLLLVVGVLAAAAWLSSKRVQRDGLVTIAGLQAAVTVRYDDRGVPHLQAANETDLYRALGYVHAQDRLFQMEMLRRLARGELAEVLGPSLLPIDRLFRTLTIRDHADAQAARLDPALPSTQALRAYLDGINQFQDSRPLPVEFELLRLPRRPFTEADTLSVSGYLAYSFAAAFRTEPVLTRIRDQWGAAYLAPFTTAPADADGAVPGAADAPAAAPRGQTPTSPGAAPAGQDTLRTQWRGPLKHGDHAVLSAWAEVNQAVIALTGLPALEGSNAWAVSGARTASGKPLLAGDPHISFALPAVWYEAHLSAPGFELYGHFQALTPVALLGTTPQAAWSLTMFQNDDIDLIAEKTDPAHPEQVLVHDAWVPLTRRESSIRVKGAEPVTLVQRRSPHGPVINDALDAGNVGGSGAPIAMWWAFLETDNPLLEAFYRLNRASSLAQAREAAALIHAPGLNVVWANTAGDIAWWAAARLPQRPPGVRADLVLDGSSAAADKPGFLPFSANPQEENPARGYLVSANHAPAGAASGVPPGYYNPPDRARRLDARLRDPATRWTLDNTRELQLDTGSDAQAALMRALVARLEAAATAPGAAASSASSSGLDEADLRRRLTAWDGRHALEDIAPTLAAQLFHELAKAVLADELGPEAFAQLLRVRALDEALARIVADADSPWWDRVDTPGKEARDTVIAQAWQASLAHLRSTFGPDPQSWTWGRAHTLTHAHPFAKQPPLDRVFNVGPFPVAGGRETPNNMAFAIGPAPWKVVYGPSTRRIVDLAAPGKALGINPLGQSGVWLDTHRADQAADYLAGRYRAQPMLEEDVKAATRSQLLLRPK